MRLVSIVTIDEVELSQSEFNRLLQSGENTVDLWVVVLRSTSKAALTKAENQIVTNLGKDAFILVSAKPCGVSEARNVGIRAFEQTVGRTAEDVLSFPDDDCSYPPEFRNKLNLALVQTQSDILLIPYGPSYSEINRERWPELKTQVNAHIASQLVASAGIFLRLRKDTPVPLFDEELGVGTVRNSAEDLEYVLRQITEGCSVAYDGFLHIEHPYKSSDPSRIVGNAACLKAYKNYISGLKLVKTLIKLIVHALTRPHTAKSRASMSPIRAAFTYNRLHGKTPVGGLLLNVGSPARLALEAARYAISTPRTTIILAAHITSLNARHQSHFVRAFNSADYAMADGISLVMVSVFSRGTRVKKMATTDFAPLFLSHLSSVMKKPLTFAVIGGEGQTAITAADRLESMTNGTCVYSSHGFRKDSHALAAEVKAIHPDVVIVGMGMPREALWVETYGQDLGAKAVITCGGWLRLLSGEEFRSPLVFQKFQLEWLWRIVTDPGRTYARYKVGVLSVMGSIIGGRRT